MAKKQHTHLHVSRRLHVRGIRNRWLRNSFLTVAAILLAIVIILSVGLSNYYYNSLRTGLEAKAKTASDFFTSYATTEDEYEWMVEYHISDFDENIFQSEIEQIVIPAPNQLKFIFHNGTRKTVEWQDRSRSESWTEEMRKTAGERSKKCRQSQPYPQDEIP